MSSKMRIIETRTDAEYYTDKHQDYFNEIFGDLNGIVETVQTMTVPESEEQYGVIITTFMYKEEES